MLGEVVGNYRITEKISEGGMGVVYRAEHQLIGKAAAVKVLQPELSDKSQIVDRFFNEARAASGIQHPGIVEIFDFGYHGDGRAYIVMEFLRGEPLQARLARLGRLPIDQAIGIIRQVASAVGAAHRAGVVHRDLKPDNIFLVPDPEVPGGERAKVLDFGIAKLADTEGGPSLKTRTGAVMGTPTYMAPEQCRGAGSVDHRADTYAIGCICFELLVGRPPFLADGVGEMIAAHLTTPPPSPRALNPSIPPQIAAVICRLLEKDPDRRFQSLEELRRTLEPSRGNTDGGAPPAAPMAPTQVAHQAPTTLRGAAAQSIANTTSPGASRFARGVFLAGVAALCVAVGVALISGLTGGSNDSSRGEPAAAATGDIAPPSKDEASVPGAQRPRADVAITLKLSPADALVELDGKVVTSNPIRIPRSDAKHKLVVSAPGYEQQSLVVEANDDAKHVVSLTKQASKRPTVTTKARSSHRRSHTQKKSQQVSSGPLETKL